MLAVLNRRTGAHLYTVEGPFVLEPEDLREWGEADGSPVLYSIAVLSSDPEDITAARSFADDLALKINGRVVDPQTYVSPGRAHSDSTENRAPVYLHVEWNRTRDGSADFAARYLEAARDHFPSAVPTRFGTEEPLQGKLVGGGDSAFDLIYREQCKLSRLILKGRSGLSGSVDGWTDELRSRFQALRLTIPLKDTADLATQDFTDFFVEVAKRTSSFFAFAELNSSLYATAASPAYKGSWGGLPRTAQWMTWYSPEYTKLVRPYLTSGVITDHPEGSMHVWTAEPSAGSALRPLVRRAPWVGSELLATLSADQERRCLQPALSMPSVLRAPLPGSPEAERIERRIAANRARAGLA
ncbi:hypothetical protein AUC47_12565 [Microbacterium sp. SZ1]|nr:hypothetical protein AUC47_12565 [Microbacterium sp. SZ1]